MTNSELKIKSYPKANRYLQNAIDILKTKANKQGRFYEDEKYVQIQNPIITSIDHSPLSQKRR